MPARELRILDAEEPSRAAEYAIDDPLEHSGSTRGLERASSGEKDLRSAFMSRITAGKLDKAAEEDFAFRHPNVLNRASIGPRTIASMG
jgi:hypothetical protein